MLKRPGICWQCDFHHLRVIKITRQDEGIIWTVKHALKTIIATVVSFSIQLYEWHIDHSLAAVLHTLRMRKCNVLTSPRGTVF